ncbi:30716_t:CDS:1, partial [Racocetra persica]
NPLPKSCIIVRRNFKAQRARITSKKRKSWSAYEKLMIIAYYKTRHSKRLTAEEFKIQTSQLRDWISKKSKLLKAALYIQKLSIGARPK